MSTSTCAHMSSSSSGIISSSRRRRRRGRSRSNCITNIYIKNMIIPLSSLSPPKKQYISDIQEWWTTLRNERPLISLVFNWNHFEMRFLNLRLNFYLLRAFFLILVVFVLFLLSLRFSQISPLAFFRWFTATSDRNDESCNRIPSNSLPSIVVVYRTTFFDQVNSSISNIIHFIASYLFTPSLNVNVFYLT